MCKDAMYYENMLYDIKKFIVNSKRLIYVYAKIKKILVDIVKHGLFNIESTSRMRHNTPLFTLVL